VPAFRKALQAYARGVLSGEAMARRLIIDTTATPEEITHESVGQIDRLRPFGSANPKPLIAIDGLGLVEEPRILKDRHLKLRLAGPRGVSLEAIGFGLAPRIHELMRGRSSLHLVATPFVNNWG